MTMLTTLALCAATLLSPAQDHDVRAAPFDAIRWTDAGEPEVRVDATWYGWDAIDELEVEELIEFCEGRWPRKAKKRVGEDLVEALTLMGLAPDEVVDLQLTDLGSGKAVVLEDVEMTAANRASVLRYNSGDFLPPRPVFKDSEDKYPTRSPFTGVRAAEAGYEVRLDDRWYRLVELDGHTTAEILEHCRRTFGLKAEKRFVEDLVEVLATLGSEATAEVDLVVADLETGQRIEREAVPMTEANRNRTRDLYQGTGSGSGVIERVEREHAAVVDPRYGFLAEPLFAAAFQGHPTITRPDAERDLDQLEWLLEHTFSYRDLTGVDRHAALDNVRLGLADEQPLGAFATRVGQLLALFGDGHTRLRSLEALRPGGYLPFLVVDADGRALALAADRSGPLDPDFPFLVALDGEPLEHWLELAGRAVAQGSPHWQRSRALRDLRLWNAQRLEAGARLADSLAVTLADAEGETRDLRLVLARSKPTYGAWPRTTEHARLDGDIGYLRIPGMESDPAFLDGLARAMESFQNTRGLVIDVRGNGGGSRDALRLLLPWFLDPEGGPRVVNVAAYRHRPDDVRGSAEGYLDNRALYPPGSRRWSADERTAIEAVASSFTPAWNPSPELFSDWHHMLVAPGPVHYGHPVVVLMDTGCFSATDIFLAAFADTTDATLLGTPSGGGSGRSRSSTLAGTGLEVRISSMASFRPGGEAYDGVGIAPDLLVVPTIADHLDGGTDTQLEAALELLR